MNNLILNVKMYLSKTFKDISLIENDFYEIEFENCHFQDCNFTNSTFKKCKFIECKFTRCNLSLTQVPQCRFTEVTFDECKLVGIDWSRAAWPNLVFFVSLHFNKCIINDSSFFGLVLDEIIIEECKAHDVDFREGSFCRANFTYTDFANSLFGKTNLSGADFSEAINYNIDIFNNKISKTKFTRYEALSLLSSLDIELVD